MTDIFLRIAPINLRRDPRVPNVRNFGAQWHRRLCLFINLLTYLVAARAQVHFFRAEGTVIACIEEDLRQADVT